MRSIASSISSNNYDIAAFFELFIKSGVAARFETGDFTLLAGMSGVELAYEVLEQSGVPLRTIQQYEQRRKDINKAQTEYLVMFAKVLCCRVEDLIEH